MIVPDTNLLVYAYHKEDPSHEAARSWWEGLVNGTETVGVPWVVSTAFVRLMAHSSVLATPMSPSAALVCVKSWFQFTHIQPINPGADHLIHFQRNLDAVGGGANLVPDAHIAALAMEHQAEVHSNDSDFSRFQGLRWRNPLSVS